MRALVPGEAMASEMPAIMEPRSQGVHDLLVDSPDLDDLALRPAKGRHVVCLHPGIGQAGILRHDQGDPPHRQTQNRKRPEQPAGDAERLDEERAGRGIVGILEPQKLPGDPHLIREDLDRPDRTTQLPEAVLELNGKELFEQLGSASREPLF